MDSRVAKIEGIKQAIAAVYEIRFNSIIGKSQYRAHGEDEFKDVNSEMMNTFKKELKANGIKCSEAELRKALEEKNFDRKKETSTGEEIEMYLITVLESRFNTIKQKPEYRYIGDDDWQPVSKYFVNSVNRQITAMGIKSSVNKLNELFFSDFSEAVNPIALYFTEMDDFDITAGDEIAKLARSVEVVNPEKWYEYLKKWLVAVVANALTDEKCCNHTMLVLTGEQGKYKTTWLDNLCPPKLRPYLFTGKIDPTSKDVQTLLAECFLINIDDQLKQMNKKDENDVKNMITVNFVKYRRPYDIFIQEYPHCASFCGSVNGNDFLTDPTGARRFLPFEVKEIHLDRLKEVDIDRVWLQAFSLFVSGFRYWFSPDEVDELNKTNQMFQVVSTEEQLLLQYFDLPDASNPATHDMQHAEILSYLQNLTRAQIAPKRLGEALVKHKFEKKRKMRGKQQLWVYPVVRKNIELIQSEMEAEKVF